MNVIHSTARQSLVVGFDVKKAMITAARPINDSLVAYLETGVAKFPYVTAVCHPRLEVSFHVIRFTSAFVIRLNVMMEIHMPCGESSLVWMPWLPHQQQPERSPGDYQHVNFGRWALMPRRTKCYDYAYGFSGQVHPVEPETPAAISALYSETCEIFGLPLDKGPNMCLENDYDNGREAISEHADDENQFGELHDVFCWVTGRASREGVFRVKTVKKAVPAGLKRYCADESSRELFSVCIPAGLYVMRGRQFQQRYTHEFPELHKSLFESLRKHGSEMEGFPVAVEQTARGAPRAPVVQAAWVKDHPNEVKRLIRSKKLKRRRDVADDMTAFDEWCEERTSYTLRNFDPAKRPK
jgi:hypothetical protein